MTPALGYAALVCVVAVTVMIGSYGLRFSRSTSDFYVASRAVSPVWNASAIGGEYLSAASFLGVAGLVLAFGVDLLWLPVGFAGGYLVLLVLVAAPLRRSGAYTLPDFAEARLESALVRRIATTLVVIIGWLYLVPQMQGAGLTLRTVTGAPAWVGGVVIAAVVGVTVLSGGMRSITLVQAVHYWIKLTALAVPVLFLVIAWRSDGAPALTSDPGWANPLGPLREHPMFATYSQLIATFLGTVGLPHVLVRFYTNPDGRAARRTTLAVLCLVGVFFMLPAVYAALGRLYVPDLLTSGRTDAVVLSLPSALIGGLGGQLLTALVSAGAFAAFLSTASGLVISVAGVVAQDVLPTSVRNFRWATLIAVTVPLTLSLLIGSLPVAQVVGLAFAVAASTFCPLLVLGIWWRRLTDAGAAAGLVCGGLLAVIAVMATVVAGARHGWLGALLAQPAAVTVPVAFAVMVIGSLLTPARVAPNVARTMVRLHVPESLDPHKTDWMGGRSPDGRAPAAAPVRRGKSTVRRDVERHRAQPSDR